MAHGAKRRIHLFHLRKQPHLVARLVDAPPGSPHTIRPARVARQSGSPKLLAAMPWSLSAIPRGAAVSGCRHGPAVGATRRPACRPPWAARRTASPGAAPSWSTAKTASVQENSATTAYVGVGDSSLGQGGMGVPVGAQGTGRQQRGRATRRRRPAAPAKGRRVTDVESGVESWAQTAADAMVHRKRGTSRCG